MEHFGKKFVIAAACVLLIVSAACSFEKQVNIGIDESTAQPSTQPSGEAPAVAKPAADVPAAATASSELAPAEEAQPKPASE